MLVDSGTEFFRLVALWISLVVVVQNILDGLIMYVYAYTYTITLMVEAFVCARLLYLAVCPCN